MEFNPSFPPPDPEAEEMQRRRARDRGALRIAARRRRVSRIRKRAIAACAVTFAAVWALLFVQLASGHDPALSNNAKAQVVTTTSSSAGSDSGSGSGSGSNTGSNTSSNTSSDSTSTSDSGSASAASSRAASTSPPLAPVTTRQS
jgi:cytoskeletal protein RodZ